MERVSVFSTEPAFGVCTGSHRVGGEPRRARCREAEQTGDVKAAEYACLLFARCTREHVFSLPTEGNLNIKIVIYITHGQSEICLKS